MKKFIIFKSLTILFIVIAFSVSRGQNPTVTINYTGTGLVIGDSISVPIVLNGTNVGSWNFLIRYDRDVLTYGRTINTVGAGGLYGANNNYTIVSPFPNAGEIVYKAGLVYTDGAPGHLYSNQTILTLRFKFNGGQTSINFINISTGGVGNGDTYVKANPYGTLNLGTTFTNGSASGAYITLTSIAGGGDWKTAASWVENKVPTRVNDVTITGNVVTDTSTTGRCHNLTINAGGKLTVATGKSLAVAGNMLIKSDASATGSFIDNGTTSVTGTTSVQRYTTGNWDGTWPPTTITWHYVSSPVSGGTINSFLGSLLNYWNEPANTWSAMTLPLTTPLVAGQGYSAATTSNQVITFTGGMLNTGNQTITGLTNTAASAARGFNLIGNAFPSAIIWDGSISKTNVDGAIYLWSGSSYITHLPADAFVIPSEQGFYVHVTTGSSTGSLVIPNTNRTHSSNSYLKSTSNEQLNLKVNGNNLEDVTSVRFNSDATEGFDSEYDAYKLWGITACPQIYSITPSDNLSINSLPEVTAQTVVPLGFKVGVNETYSITASGMETFPTGTDIYLEDLLLNKTQNLNTNPVYEFPAVTGSIAHRFDIHFSPFSGIAEGTTSNIRIYSAENCVYVNIPMELHGEIIVYDLLGKEVKRQPIQTNSLNKVSMNAELGYYLVKVQGDVSTVSGKVFIR